MTASIIIALLVGYLVGHRRGRSTVERKLLAHRADLSTMRGR